MNVEQLNGKVSAHGPTAVPSLDQIARNPALVDALPADLAGKLLMQVKALEGALLARLLVHGAAKSEAAAPAPKQTKGKPKEPEDLLSVDEAATILHKPRRWLFENAARLPFVHRVSKKSLLCSANGLRAWVEAQQR